ncbi:MAG: pyridoxamine 5-phosphate oxidase family protein, partial [Rubritepida sp.]|nr:pyridoxamine 5-phosphate oxidase family protein [Rubritepida sp.]
TSVPFFFIATAHGEAVDCSFRGGAPGFVKVTGPSTLEWPEYDGNSMYRTAGNILRSPRTGLLFLRSAPGHAPPPPAWKARDYIRDALPRDDAHRAEVGSLEPPRS